MRVRLTSFLLLLLFARSVQATHIVGGEMFYDQQGIGQYLVTLELYRDCSPSNTQGTGFDNTAWIGVFTGNGVFLFTQSLNYTGEIMVPVIIDNPCLSAPPNVCVATTSYEAVFSLPPIPEGYVLSYQRCCRTPSIVNLLSPNVQGVTCTISIPGNTIATNSSPRFSGYPPVVLCLGDTIIFDHSANDPDSDQLVYELFTPYHGGSFAVPAPTQPDPPPYQQVNWGAGYSAAYPLDSEPAIQIEPSTGTITLTPTLIGSFAVGVMVKEFRNGVLLSEAIRDFKFDVVACETTIISSIQAQDPAEHCAGLTVNLQNQSVNGSFWRWDFGDPTTDADTSSLANPTWTYAQGGSYQITLIANPGWPCADTSHTVFHTSPLIAPHFPVPPILCPGEGTTLVASGSIPTGATLQWQIPEEAVAETTTGPFLSCSFTTPGEHSITLVVSLDECTGSFTDFLVVEPYPEVLFTSDEQGCLGDTFTFTDSSITSSSAMYQWHLGDGTTSAAQHPVHTYSEPGTYSISLIVRQWHGCTGADTLVMVDHVHVHPLPEAGFELSPRLASVIDPEIQLLDQSRGAVAWIYSVEEEIYNTQDALHYFQGDGHVPVWQTVISEYGCRDSTMREAFITDHLFFAPNTFTPNGDGLNDTFAPKVVGARLFELVIYDRYGAEVYRSRDPEAEWSGDDRPAGIYTYTAHIAEHGTHREFYSGHITLVR
jgi:gliding motility-associated-like protein